MRACEGRQLARGGRGPVEFTTVRRIARMGGASRTQGRWNRRGAGGGVWNGVRVWEVVNVGRWWLCSLASKLQYTGIPGLGVFVPLRIFG